MQFSILDLSKQAQIQALFQNTFSDSEGVDEGVMIGDLANQIVATTDSEEMVIVGASKDETLVGCVIFTKFHFQSNTTNAYLLSPAAIATATQGQGVGQKLIQFGLDTLKQQGVELVLTYGDPRFYGKVGFVQITEEQVKAPLVLSYPHGWLGQKLDGSELVAIESETLCASALNDQKYW
ncbi:GNAT family N-acetyltransferase [Vibrio renipiscarius]|uniref:GNAT family N-acetyltransferase n=1 Tax=Vibrio renipiscarius TaxID=1461322 RepID=UPI00354D202E